MDGPKIPRLEEVCSTTFLFLTTFLRNVGKADFELDWVRTRLTDLLEEQKRMASRDGELYKLYEKAQYLLVVTADGLILNSEWPQRFGWNLLEAELYGTNIGGEEFFQRMKDPAYKHPQLLEIFFLCLSVGFSGKYLGHADELAEIRQDLFLRLSDVPRDLTEKITPQSYEETLSRDFTSMPVVNVLQLTAILGGIIVLLIALSWAFYSSEVGNIADRTARAAQGITEDP